MGGFGCVEVGADAVAAGEGGGGHEGAVKDVALLNLRVVEEDGEGVGVQEGYDPGVGGDEGAWGHVGADDGGVVLLDSGGEELVAALVVEEVVAVHDGPEEGKAIASGDWFQRKLLMLLGVAAAGGCV